MGGRGEGRGEGEDGVGSDDLMVREREIEGGWFMKRDCVSVRDVDVCGVVRAIIQLLYMRATTSLALHQTAIAVCGPSIISQPIHNIRRDDYRQQDSLTPSRSSKPFPPTS